LEKGSELQALAFWKTQKVKNFEKRPAFYLGILAKAGYIVQYFLALIASFVGKCFHIFQYTDDVNQGYDQSRPDEKDHKCRDYEKYIRFQKSLHT
jgi:hypothetical protein